MGKNRRSTVFLRPEEEEEEKEPTSYYHDRTKIYWYFQKVTSVSSGNADV